jgi:hypothetical protein
LNAVLYFAQCFNICADNRNLLMHSIVGIVEVGDTILSLLKGAKSDPRDYRNLKFDAPTLRQTADEIWCLDQYGTDVLFYLLTRAGQMSKTELHARSTLPEKPPPPNNLSLLLDPSGQGRAART